MRRRRTTAPPLLQELPSAAARQLIPLLTPDEHRVASFERLTKVRIAS